MNQKSKDDEGKLPIDYARENKHLKNTDALKALSEK